MKKIILALLIVSIALIGISSVSAHDVNANNVKDNIELCNVISEVDSIENNTVDENNGDIHGEFINNTDTDDIALSILDQLIF